MENVPPSYDAAIARNPWSLIAPFIPSTELCALNRVCRELQNVFAPYLWGNPASHFGTENDRVYGQRKRSITNTLGLSDANVWQWL